MLVFQKFPEALQYFLETTDNHFQKCIFYLNVMVFIVFSLQSFANLCFLVESVCYLFLCTLPFWL